MAGNIVVGKNNGGFSENPPNLTHHLFTCNVILRKKKGKSTEFTSHIAKFYTIFLPDCVLFLFQSKRAFKIKCIVV